MTWVDGELWHGTWEGDESDIRGIDPKSGKVLARLTMPEGVFVSGLESDGAGLFYAGGGPSGKVRAVRRPQARLQNASQIERPRYCVSASLETLYPGRLIWDSVSGTPSRVRLSRCI
jgi:hypothetical protein